MKRSLKNLAIAAACLTIPVCITACGGDDNAEQKTVKKVDRKKIQEAQAKLKEKGIECSRQGLAKHLRGNCKAEVLQLFIDAGMTLNDPNILMMVIMRGTDNEEVVKCAKILLQQGVNVNASNKDGQTALHLAVGRGNVELVKLLIEAKADVNAKDKSGMSVLDRTFSSEISDLLMAAGAKKRELPPSLNF